MRKILLGLAILASSLQLKAVTCNIQATAAPINPKCAGGTGSATINITGGTSPYTYTWSTNATTTPTGTTTRTRVRATLPAGTFTITIADANGCSTKDSITITAPAALSFTTSAQNTGCGADSGWVKASVTGGTGLYTYSWSNGAKAAKDSMLAAGSYSLTVTDANGCSLTNSEIITNTSNLSATINSYNVLCNGGHDGAAKILVTGGTGPFKYAWKANPTSDTIATPTLDSIYHLKLGTYTAVVTDTNGCSFSVATTITQPTKITVSVRTTTPLCFGDSGVANVFSGTGGTGSLTYQWSNNATGTSSGKIVAGTYSLTVTDANACTSITTSTLTQPNPIKASFTNTPPLCFGLSTGSVTVTGSGGSALPTVRYKYKWTANDTAVKLTIDTTNKLTGIPAGIYSVVLTDRNTCTAMAVDTIIEPTALGASLSAIGSTCATANGTVMVAPMGGTAPYSYSWNTGSTLDTVHTLPAGNYHVVITDAHKCLYHDSIVVKSISVDSIKILSIVNPLCYKGSNGGVLVNAVNLLVPMESFRWVGNGVDTTIAAKSLSVGLDHLTAGTYSVSGIDSNQCALVPAIATIQQGNPISVKVLSYGNGCTTCTPGTAYLEVSGGTHPYTIGWYTYPANSLIASGDTAYNLLSGVTYLYTITDSNKCNASDTISLNLINTGIDQVGGNANGFTSNIEVYPNPSQGNFTLNLNLPQAQDLQISIINTMGQKVFVDEQHQINNYNKQFNLNGLATGVYTLQVMTEGETLVRRIVKE